VFYMVSFLFYFLGPSYAMLVTGSIFYGLGEAFRSGTHKAMEMQWLERHKLQEYKSYLYGITRSWSLYGSALNAVFSILLVFLIGDRGDQWIFLFAIIPFALDFILISTYPKYMNELLGEKGESVGQKFKKQFQHIKLFFKKKKFQKGVLSSTLHDSIFKTIKDYIQPIMRALIGVLILHFGLDQQRSDLWVKMILGVIYAVFYLLSSFTSRNAYKVEEKVKNTKKTLDILLDVMAIFILLEAIFYWLEIPELIIIIYMLIYLLYNLRRPIMVGYIGEMAPNEQRATILSVETQTKSIFIFIMAPVFGYIADQLSIAWLFLMISILMLVSNIFLKGEIKLREEDLDLDE